MAMNNRNRELRVFLLLDKAMLELRNHVIKEFSPKHINSQVIV